MKLIVPEHHVKASGHYSPGVLSNGTLYISGQLPNDVETGALPDGIEALTRACLDKVDAVLHAAGLSRDKVVMCRAFIADSSLWDPVNSVYADFFGEHAHKGRARKRHRPRREKRQERHEQNAEIGIVIRHFG